MPDLTALASALASLKAAGDIAKAMINLRDAAAFNTKMIEFQTAIIDAQDRALAANEERSVLIQRVSGLEKQIAQLEAWEAEKQRYELKEVSQSAFAYVLKPEASAAEPSHWICARCYQHGKKSILQGRGDVWGTEPFKCHECGNEIIFVHSSDSAVPPRKGY